MKKKKLHFFKNDPFDIKYKIFRRKIKSSMEESIKLHTKSLALCLKIIITIGYPSDDEELEILRNSIQKYDMNIQELEKRYVKRARKYIDNDIEKAKALLSKIEELEIYDKEKE